ncbi:MAG: M48 family metallopeptidase [Burkholderiales bacterium]|nr:M48 family metallopeptidase [Burkholderiales bacterium]
MTPQIFEKIFIVALSALFLLKLWLSMRHVAHIRECRSEVPEDFRDRISLADHRKAADYTIAVTRTGIASDFVETVLAFWFTLGGGLSLLDSFWAERISGPILQGCALIGSAVLVMEFFELPVSIYRTFLVEAKFGFNRMTPALFFIDALKKGILASILGFPLVAGILWLMSEMGRNWWIEAWFAWMAFNLLILSIYPNWIAPFFNQFRPLEDSETRNRIERLLAKCGFSSKGLFVMDGSKRSSHGNAYFSGFGKTKRIVFYDTLLEKLDGSEIEAVLAHELGHFMHHHIVKRILVSFAFSLVFLWALGMAKGQSWFFEGLHAHSRSDAMALLLFFMVAPSFTFSMKPLSSFYSRKNEFEADAYAAKQAGGEDLIRALTKLYQESARTLTPDPLYSMYHDSHPPASIRIAHLRQAMHNR